MWIHMLNMHKKRNKREKKMSKQVMKKFQKKKKSIIEWFSQIFCSSNVCHSLFRTHQMKIVIWAVCNQCRSVARSGACMSFIHFRSKCLHFSGISKACRCYVAILPLSRSVAWILWLTFLWQRLVLVYIYNLVMMFLGKSICTQCSIRISLYIASCYDFLYKAT